MPLPKYLYHAAPFANAKLIKKTGLKPFSGGGTYLCMSGSEAGSATLRNQASDIIFRVARTVLKEANWSKKGAGKDEWRSDFGIEPQHLEYRRRLALNKDAETTKWKKNDASKDEFWS